MPKLVTVREREEACFFDTQVLRDCYTDFFDGFRSTNNSRSNYEWGDSVKIFTSKEFHVPRIQEHEVSPIEALKLFETTTYLARANGKQLFNGLLSTWPEISLAANFDQQLPDLTTAIEVFGKFIEADPDKAKEIISAYEQLLSPIHKVKWRLVKPLIIPPKAIFKATLQLAEPKPFYGRLILRGVLAKDVM